MPRTPSKTTKTTVTSSKLAPTNAKSVSRPVTQTRVEDTTVMGNHHPFESQKAMIFIIMLCSIISAGALVILAVDSFTSTTFDREDDVKVYYPYLVDKDRDY